MPKRFEIGQFVVINGVIASKHSGKRAVIVDYRPSRREIHTLDKYLVKISDGEQIELWAIQLESESAPSGNAAKVT